jgi:hypothetical protein
VLDVNILSSTCSIPYSALGGVLGMRCVLGAKPTDNVPNWVQMATGEPFRKLHPVKGKGRTIW